MAVQAEPSSMKNQISIINIEMVAAGAVSAGVVVKAVYIGVVMAEAAIAVVAPEEIEAAELKENMT